MHHQDWYCGAFISPPLSLLNNVHRIEDDVMWWFWDLDLAIKAEGSVYVGLVGQKGEQNAARERPGALED